MRHLLLIFTILIFSCSGAESILERDNSQPVSATPSIEPISSTNEELKLIEERLTELASAIENNTIALENLSKSISSANIISDQNNPPLVEEIEKSDEEDYGKSPNNPVKVGKPLEVDMVSDLFEIMGDSEYISKIYLEKDAEVIFGPADGYPNNSKSDVFINKTETFPFAVPINFEDAQTNKPISLSYKDEYELPLKFSLSNNSGIAGNHLIENPLMIDLMVISDGAVFKGQVLNYKYLFIEVD